MSNLIYLAGPYSANRERFYQIHLDCTAHLLKQGQLVFSPIAHCHDAAAKHSMPTDFLFWFEYNKAMLSRCDQLYIIDVPGWQESRGVQGEITVARSLNKPVFLYTVEGGPITLPHLSQAALV